MQRRPSFGAICAALLPSLFLSSAMAAADPRPDPDALFSAMGIQLHGPQKQFVLGDNVDGYLDGMTGSYRQRPGYWVGNEVLWQDHAAYRDGRLLDRRSRAATETVYPFGRKVALPDAAEDLVLHAGSRRLSVRVTSRSAGKLSVQPLWAFRPEAASFSWEGEVLLVTPPGSPLVLALSADQAFEMLPAPPGSVATDMPLLQAKSAGQAFTLHLAIAASRAQAVAQARAMAQGPDLMAQTRAAWHARLTRSWLRSSDDNYNRALLWAKASALSFLVDEYGRGLWAGLPWFRENWGRDTFIALPGTLLVSGHFKDAKEVLEST